MHTDICWLTLYWHLLQYLEIMAWIPWRISMGMREWWLSLNPPSLCRPLTFSSCCSLCPRSSIRGEFLVSVGGDKKVILHSQISLPPVDISDESKTSVVWGWYIYRKFSKFKYIEWVGGHCVWGEEFSSFQQSQFDVWCLHNSRPRGSGHHLTTSWSRRMIEKQVLIMHLLTS